MADSKRLVILKALTAQLKTINGTDGYTINLNNRVYRGRNRFGETEQLPAIAILESMNPDRGPSTAGGSEDTKQIDDWVLLIQGWAVDDKDNPADPAHILMGEVKKCLAKIAVEVEGNTAFLLGGLIEEIQLEPGTVRPPDETSAQAYFWMRISLKVVERLFDPFDIT